MELAASFVSIRGVAFGAGGHDVQPFVTPHPTARTVSHLAHLPKGRFMDTPVRETGRFERTVRLGDCRTAKKIRLPTDGSHRDCARFDDARPDQFRRLAV